MERKNRGNDEPKPGAVEAMVSAEPFTAIAEGVLDLAGGVASEVAELLSPQEARRRELGAAMGNRGRGRER
jgi:hypothetical protein